MKGVIFLRRNANAYFLSRKEKIMDKRLFEKRCKYSIRKFSLGVASVIIGATFFGTSTVLADTAQTGSTANMPADLAAALANAKDDNGHDFEAPKPGENQGSPEVTEGPKTEEELLEKEKEAEHPLQLKMNFLKIYAKNSIRLKIVDILLQKMT